MMGCMFAGASISTRRRTSVDVQTSAALQVATSGDNMLGASRVDDQDRCIMTANSERKKIHENCYCAEHTVCGGKCERRVECDRPCMKPAWHMKGHAVFPSCLPKSSTFFTICDCLDKHERQTSLDRKVKRKHKAIQGKQDPRKHAQQVFDQFDKCLDLSTSLSSDTHARDHSGSIEFEELMELLALMETAVSEEEAIRIMQVADRDGSGQVAAAASPSPLTARRFPLMSSAR